MKKITSCRTDSRKESPSDELLHQVLTMSSRFTKYSRLPPLESTTNLPDYDSLNLNRLALVWREQLSETVNRQQRRGSASPRTREKN